jgi:hypothetical protein
LTCFSAAAKPPPNKRANRGAVSANYDLNGQQYASKTRRIARQSIEERTQHTEVCTGCLLTVEVEVGLDGTVL